MSEASHKDPKNKDVELETTAEEFVDFLKDPKAKNAMKEFMVEAYKEFEAKRFARFKARMEHERQVDESQTIDPALHSAGNIAPLMDKHLNMHETEDAFVRSMKVTKKGIVRTVEERVEEINRLLAGIGGFCSQLKSCFARSTVVFLEQEDPLRPFRERLIFSVNLPNYELKSNWKGMEDAKANGKPAVKGKAPDKPVDPSEPGADGRTQLQATWDGAVNALAQIIEGTGLKPKYCKNDRHFGRFVMKQDLRHNSQLPDEYFSFTLDYNTAEKIHDMCGPYNQIVATYDKKLNQLSKKLDRWPQDSTAARFLELKKKYLAILKDRDFFVGTTPDPNQMDEGLLFMIEVSTLKDYQVVKDRMQSIMTRYILHLSKIATTESAKHADLEHELKRIAIAQAHKPEPIWAAGGESLQGGGGEIQEYEVDVNHLKPLKGRKPA